MTQSDSSHAPATGRSWLRLPAGLRHHGLVALFVASVVTLLHGSGLLGWLDVLLISISGNAQQQASQPRADADLPVVLMIGSTLYERGFAQTSPLDRGVLAQVIDAIPRAADQAPALLAIDLDLSPVRTADAPDALDQSLQRLAEAGTQLLLVLPFRVATDEQQRIKFAWMQRLCAWNGGGQGIFFAHNDALFHMGQAVQYDAASPNLGVAAADLARAQSVCAQIAAQGDKAMQPLLSDLFPAAASAAPQRLRLFNARFFAAGSSHIRVLRDVGELADPATGAGLQLAGRSVFLGGGFDTRDRFDMPLARSSGRVEGVILHAATYYSEKQPVHAAGHLLAFVIDIAVGLLMGWLFSLTWQRYADARDYSETAPSAGAVALRRGLLLGHVLLAVVAIWLATYATVHFLYPNNLWIHPGPIILGVFAKSLLAGAHHGHAAAPAPRAIRLVDGCVGIAVVAAALYQLLFTHH